VREEEADDDDDDESGDSEEALADSKSSGIAWFRANFARFRLARPLRWSSPAT